MWCFRLTRCLPHGHDGVHPGDGHFDRDGSHHHAGRVGPDLFLRQPPPIGEDVGSRISASHWIYLVVEGFGEHIPKGYIRSNGVFCVR